jgi:hypothetical protein
MVREKVNRQTTGLLVECIRLPIDIVEHGAVSRLSGGVAQRQRIRAGIVAALLKVC